MLQNRIYRGEIVHKDQSYPGEHEAIIDAPLWDAVQSRLQANRVHRVTGAEAQAPSLLAGLLFDSAGERLIPTHTRNNQGARYRYYISQGLINGRRTDTPTGRRLPAGDVEELVEARLGAFLQNGSEILAALTDTEDTAAASDRVKQAAALTQRWPELPASEKRHLLLVLIESVTVRPQSIEIRFRPGQLAAALEEPAINDHPLAKRRTSNDVSAPGNKEPIITWSVPAHLKRTGIEKRLLVEGADHRQRRRPDHSLARLLALAHRYQALLMRGADKTVKQLAKEAGVTGSYFTRALRLSFLAPTITKSILRNCHPLELTAKRLANEIRLPLDWASQRALLGIE